MGATADTANELAAGWARRQIAIEPRGHAMSGYGMSDHLAYMSRTPLYARALVVRDDSGALAALCCLDMAMVTHAMRRATVARLIEALGDAFDEEAFVLTCTHTHSSPGGCGHEAMYNWVTPGFDSEQLEAVTEASVAATVAAVESAAPAVVTLGTETFPADEEVAWNRAIHAHIRNREVTGQGLADTHLAIDREMSVLTVSRDGRAQAVLSLFGVHATCLGNHLRALDGDNKGRAARRTEDLLRAAGAEDPVAIFAQVTAGDVSPHYHGPGQLRRRRSVRRRGDVEYAERNGALQSDRALRAAGSAGVELHGPVDGVLEYADFSSIAVDTEHADGVDGVRTVDPCHGVAFFLGTPVDGKGMPKPVGAVARGLARRVRSAWLGRPSGTPSLDGHQQLYRYQGNKDILLEAGPKLALGSPLRRAPLPGLADPTIAEMKRQARSGALDSSPLVPTVLPVQIVRIGTLAIVCCPGEFTTVAGRRMRATTRDALQREGIEHVQLLTYSNDYMGYVTTPEEYDEQTYEGGHTIFGRWTLGAFLSRVTALSTQLGKPRGARRHHDRARRPPEVSADELALRADLGPHIAKSPYGPRTWRRIVRSIDRETSPEIATLPRASNWHRCSGRRVSLRVELDVAVDVHTLFTAMTDPGVAAKLYWPVRLTHLRDGVSAADRFGAGSLRRFSPFRGISYTEQVLEKVPDELLSWTLVEGAPISNHLGTMRFEALDDRNSRLVEHVELTVDLPGVAHVLAPIVWRANARAFLRVRALLERRVDVESDVVALLRTAPVQPSVRHPDHLPPTE